MLLGCSTSDRWVNYHSVWMDRPNTLEICDSLKVDSDKAVELANWFHTDVGDSYPFFGGEEITYSNCRMPAEYRVIRVQKITTDTMLNTEGATFTAAKADYIWEYDTIENPPGSFNTRLYMYSCTVNIWQLNSKQVIRHEFGHCWGWNHTQNDQWTHLMSPWVGKDLEGLYEMPHEDWVNWDL